MAEITYFIAFLAGIVSFLSPCVLPLIPGFIGYLSGARVDRRSTFLHSVAYVAGFTTVFALLGLLLATVLSSVSYTAQLLLSRASGIIIIVLGVHTAGWVRIPFLNQERSLQVRRERGAYATSFLFGAAFAVGWTPCIGPVLGAMLALVASQPAHGFGLLLIYSLGLGLPFLAVGLFSGQALAYIKKHKGFLRWFNITVGIMLIFLGVLIFTQTLSLFADWSTLIRVLS
jgi:cytochrome c-type biogenesis protein